ncbi:hypothetical protein [Streptomyces sp. NPDC058330]|uniref:hypothetical protein n=1 Tax=Streptomyces sp. NPDC058330 TaxID=3346449 RepID=UPI0036F037C4
MGEWEIPRIPLQYERAVLARAVVREKLHTTTAAAVRGRAYDVVAHQQAAMPEQLLAPEPADPEHDDQEQKPGRREALDTAALRALREARTDVEALDMVPRNVLKPAPMPGRASAGCSPFTSRRRASHPSASARHPAHRCGGSR